ncbi:hypothetical protein SUDANB6_00437 [Streptomyces sp. enrichment culture]
MSPARDAGAGHDRPAGGSAAGGAGAPVILRYEEEAEAYGMSPQGAAAAAARGSRRAPPATRGCATGPPSRTRNPTRAGTRPGSGPPRCSPHRTRCGRRGARRPERGPWRNWSRPGTGEPVPTPEWRRALEEAVRHRLRPDPEREPAAREAARGSGPAGDKVVRPRRAGRDAVSPGTPVGETAVGGLVPAPRSSRRGGRRGPGARRGTARSRRRAGAPRDPGPQPALRSARRTAARPGTGGPARERLRRLGKASPARLRAPGTRDRLVAWAG